MYVLLCKCMPMRMRVIPVMYVHVTVCDFVRVCCTIDFFLNGAQLEGLGNYRPASVLIASKA